MSKPKLRDYLRIHIDIPNIIIILLCVLILYPTLSNWAFSGIEWISKKVTTPSWWGEVGVNVLSEFIAFALLAFLGYLIVLFSRKPYYAGKFKTFEVTKKAGQSDTEVEWGELRLSYNLFTKRLKGVMRSLDQKVCIELNGVFEKERYFRGTYIEKDKPSRLRLGAFLMQMQLDGDNYEGAFIHFSPTTGLIEPELGYAKWEKLK